MRFLRNFIIILLVTTLFALLLPWWTIAAGAAVICLLLPQPSAGKDFLAGFLAVGILFLVIATWINMQNASILAERMGQLFEGLPGWVLILLGGVFGGLAGGLGALTGNLAKKALFNRRNNVS